MRDNKKETDLSFEGMMKRLKIAEKHKSCDHLKYFANAVLYNNGSLNLRIVGAEKEEQNQENPQGNGILSVRYLILHRGSAGDMIEGGGGRKPLLSHGLA